MTNHDSAVIPEDLAYLLTTDHIGHVSFIRLDGSVGTALMWVGWDGEHVLTSSPVGEYQGRVWRANPSIGVSVVDHYDDWRSVSVEGRVTEIRPDVNLEFIDLMSTRYLGMPYRRRNFEREIYVITPDRVRFSHGGWAPKKR